MANGQRTLLFSGWSTLIVGLGGIFLPVLVAHALGTGDHPILPAIVLSALFVTAAGGAMTLLSLNRSHQGQPPGKNPETGVDQERCDAIFQWQRDKDPGDSDRVMTMMSIQNAAIRSLATRLYQQPSVQFKLTNIPCTQAENYRHQLANCGITCTLEPATSPIPEPLPSQIHRLIALLPANPLWFTTATTVIALFGIVWPLLIPSWHFSRPEKSEIQQLLPRPHKLLPDTKPLILPPKGSDLPTNLQHLVATLTLLDIPFAEVADKRNQAVAALNKRKPKEAEKILVHAVTTLLKEGGKSPLKDGHLLDNAAHILETLGELQLMQSKPAQAANYFAHAVELTPAPDQRTQLLQQQGDALYQAGDLQMAEKIVMKSVETAKNEIGAKHPQVVTSLTSLGLFYESQGNHEKAEPILREALSIQEELHGPADIKATPILDGLAALLANQNRLQEAEAIEKQSLQIKEKTFGSDNQELIPNLEILADILSKKGRREEADQVHERALDIQAQNSTSTPERENTASLPLPQPNDGPVNFEQKTTPAPGNAAHETAVISEPQATDKTLPPPVPADPGHSLPNDTPPDISSLNGLASRYYSEGNYEKALALFKRSLDQKIASLGEKDPAVAASMNNLASILASLGRFNEAAPLFEKSLKIKQETLPATSLSVATSMKNLATIYSSQNRLKEAEQLHARSLEIYQSNLGMNHLEVATGLNNLAQIYDRQGRYGEAEPLFRRSLAIVSQTSPANQAHISVILQNYAGLLRRMNRPFEAEKIETQARGFQVK